MPDSYRDQHLAVLYDRINTWAECDDFYLDLVMSAAAVLDVGCGTGMLLKQARAHGHGGRLTGIDPADAMLSVARAQSDVEWVVGTAADIAWRGEFDLAVMTGHAFQELHTDDDIRSSLHAIRAALGHGGRFIFETRNPLARAWESWAAMEPFTFTMAEGVPVTCSFSIGAMSGGVVHMSETFTSELWDEPQTSRGALRFATVEELDAALADAGFAVAARYGDWQRSGYTETSPEIVTVANVR